MYKDIHEIYWPVHDNEWISGHKKSNMNFHEDLHRAIIHNDKYGVNCDNTTFLWYRIVIPQILVCCYCLYDVGKPVTIGERTDSHHANYWVYHLSCISAHASISPCVWISACLDIKTYNDSKKLQKQFNTWITLYSLFS